MGFKYQVAVDFGVSTMIEGNSLNQLGFATKWICKALDKVVK